MAEHSTSGFAPLHNFHPRPSTRPVTRGDVTQIAYIRLVTDILSTKPQRIVGTYADRVDVEDRAEHLKRLLDSLVAYVDLILSDTADYAHLGTHPNGIDRADLIGPLKDVVSEIIGGLNRAAEGL